MTEQLTIAGASCEVIDSTIGFVVMWDGSAMPRSLPGTVFSFSARRRAEEYARAVDRGDIPACHALLAEHATAFQIGRPRTPEPVSSEAASPSRERAS